MSKRIEIDIPLDSELPSRKLIDTLSSKNAT